MRKYTAGVTLVELMIVVAVLAILASVGYPLYTEQVRKARRSDARGALMQIALAQERFQSINGSYTTVLTALDLPNTLQGGSTEAGYYGIAVAAGATTFTLTATPTAGKSQEGDSDCQSLIVDQTGAKSGTGGAPEKCW